MHERYHQTLLEKSVEPKNNMGYELQQAREISKISEIGPPAEKVAHPCFVSPQVQKTELQKKRFEKASKSYFPIKQ